MKKWFRVHFTYKGKPCSTDVQSDSAANAMRKVVGLSKDVELGKCSRMYLCPKCDQLTFQHKEHFVVYENNAEGFGYYTCCDGSDPMAVNGVLRQIRETERHLKEDVL